MRWLSVLLAPIFFIRRLKESHKIIIFYMVIFMVFLRKGTCKCHFAGSSSQVLPLPYNSLMVLAVFVIM